MDKRQQTRQGRGFWLVGGLLGVLSGVLLGGLGLAFRAEASDDPNLLPSQTRRLVQFLESADPKLREDAQKQLLAIGIQAAKALPEIAEGLRSPNWQLRRFAVRLVARLSPARDAVTLLQPTTTDPDQRVRETCMQVLQGLGIEAIPAFQSVLSQNDAWKMRWMAAESIGALGEKAISTIPVLREAIQDREERVQIAVLQALAKIGAKAVPILRNTLIRNEKWLLRWEAARSLEKIGAPAASAVPELTQAIQDPEARVRDAAIRALARLGPAASPGLLRALQYSQNPQERMIAAQALGKIGEKGVEETSQALFQSLRDPDPLVREEAAQALAALGAKAIPSLQQTLKDGTTWKIRWNAARGLGKAKPPEASSLPFLLAALQDKELRVQEAAAEALAEHATLPEAADPLAQAASTSSWWRLRWLTVEGLGKIPKPTSAVLAALRKASTDQELSVRRQAVRALAALKTGAVPLLIEILKTSKEGEMRSQAAEALEQKGDTARSAIPTLKRSILDEEERVQRAAARALARIGPTSAPPLIRALRKSTFPHTRFLAAQALGAWSSQASLSLPALKTALQDKDFRIREASIHSIHKLRGFEILKSELASNSWWRIRWLSVRFLADTKRPDLVTLMARATKDADSRVREEAIRALARLGPEAMAALIENLRNKEDRRSRFLAAIALGKFGAQAERAIEPLRDALSDEDPRVRETAAESLGFIGSSASSAMPALIQKLSDPDIQVRRTVAETIGQISKNGSTAIPALEKALNDPSAEVQLAAARTLGILGLRAIDPLRHALSRHPTPEIRKIAAEALGNLRSKAAKAIPELTKALQDENDQVKEASMKTLTKIGERTLKIWITALKSNEWWGVRRIAAEALGDTKNQASLKTLLANMDDADIRVKAAVLLALGEHGPAAKAALPTLRTLARSSDFLIRQAARRALEQIDRK